MNAQQPTYVFAGGGTGGHLAPAIAVAEYLATAHPHAKVLFACTDRAIDRRVLEPTGYGMVPQPVQPFPRRPLQAPGFLLAWLRSKALARQLIRDVQPAAVVGLGGFAAGPLVRVAASQGVRTALLNPDAVPGKANQYLARHVEAIFTQFPATAEWFPVDVRSKVRMIGCPIRAKVLGADRAEAMAELGLAPQLKTLMITGGSLGAQTINEAVLANMDFLASRATHWQVLHITGPGKSQEAQRAYRAAGVRHVVMDFCDRMGFAYAASDLVIARAGANTVAELTASGSPALLLPYPFHRDQHQRHNAEGMAQAGAAVLVNDSADAIANARTMRAALEGLLDDFPRLERMARASAELGRPGAAAVVGEWLIGGG